MTENHQRFGRNFFIEPTGSELSCEVGRAGKVFPAQERVKFSRSRGEASRAGKFYTLECRKKDSRSRGVASRAGIDLTCPTDLAGQPNRRVYIMVKMHGLNCSIELSALLRLKYVRNQVLISSLHQILNF